MMNMTRFLAIASTVSALCMGTSKTIAQPGQGGGNFNFDPAQIQKMMMDNYREQLEVKEDAEWKLIEDRIQKVTDARRETGFGGGMGMMRMFGRGGQRGGGDPGQGGGQRGGGRGFGGFAPTVSPEDEGLQKAIDSKATNAELKAALAKVVEARKQKQANLEKAQAELRKVLSLRQEAIASMSGLL